MMDSYPHPKERKEVEVRGVLIFLFSFVSRDLVPIPPHSETLAHSHTLTYAYTHTLTYTLRHTLTYAYTHAHTPTQTRTQAHIHKR